MYITYQSRKKLKKLANRYHKNAPCLCKNHLSDGLPIDEPDVKNLSDNHPHIRFINIVNRESNKKNAPKTKVRKKLRNLFADYYYKYDHRFCVVCYENRLKSDYGVPIRMNVPDKYDDISPR